MAPLATTHPLVCGVSCWYLNTLKSVPLWAWHASPPHLGPCPSGVSSSFAIHLSTSACRDQSLQPPSDSLFMNIPFLFRNAGPTSQGLHGAGRRVKPWVFGAMPGPEVTLNRWGGRSACRGGLGTPCRGQGVGVLQREPRASWPKCHPEQLRLYANGGSREGLTGRGSAGFHELLTNNPGTPRAGTLDSADNSSPRSAVAVSSPFYARTNRGSERAGGLPGVTQPSVCGRPGFDHEASPESGQPPSAPPRSRHWLPTRGGRGAPGCSTPTPPPPAAITEKHRGEVKHLLPRPDAAGIQGFSPWCLGPTPFEREGGRQTAPSVASFHVPTSPPHQSPPTPQLGAWRGSPGRSVSQDGRAAPGVTSSCFPPRSL